MERTLELAFLYADACSFAAAMAKSETVSVSRLEAGQKLLEQHASKFGGRIIDKAGDSMLVAFNSLEPAFLAARDAVADIRKAHDMPIEQQPFQYRMGITAGRVQASHGALYGHCINIAARIGSLVNKGNIGVAANLWPGVARHAEGSPTSARRLFAKPDEPFIDFVEVDTSTGTQGGGLMLKHTRNEPVVAVLNHITTQSPDETLPTSGLLEALNWEFGSYFSSYGWHTQVHNARDFGLLLQTLSADYIVKCGTTESRAGARVFASLSSPHLKHGIQTFSRDADQPQHGLVQVMALVSLVGSAIAQSERERALHMRSAGVHQLVAAGRASIAAFTQEGFAKGMNYLRQAQTLDPDYPLLLSSFARAHAVAWRFGWQVSRDDNMEVALQMSGRAHALEPDDARCEADLAFVKFWANETHDAVWHYERSIDVLPYHAELAADAGMVLGYAGQRQKAARILERSVANIPNDVDYRLWSLGDVYHSMQDYQQSLNWLSRMRDQSQAQRLMVANKVRLGLDPTPHVAKVLELQPNFSVNRWMSIQPFTDERERIDFEEALLQAGLPH